MTNKCKDFDTCTYTFNFRQGLDGPDKSYSTYVHTVCSQGGSEDCPHDNKTIDKKLI